jgi:hypothetical protein
VEDSRHGDDAVPTWRRDAAYNVCRIGVAACAAGDPTAIQLALATDTGSGQLDANGNLQLTLDHTLVWAITWLSIPCSASRGGPPVEPSPSGSETPVPAVQPLCDEIAFVDAASGRYFFTYTGPHQ